MSDTTRKRILIMDDSLLFLEVAHSALEGAGYEVLQVTNLQDLDKYDYVPKVDLVLMDVQMPEVYGDDVAMVLREVRGMHAPIYLLSSLDGALLRERATEAGIDGFICKHDGVDALVERVNEILASGGAA